MSGSSEEAVLPETGAHFCLSDAAGCSGVRPCDECRNFIRNQILPAAMSQVGGPFIASIEQAISFMEAFDSMYEVKLAELVEAQRQYEAALADGLVANDEAGLHGHQLHGMGAAEDEAAPPVGNNAEDLREFLTMLPEDELREVQEQIQAGTFPDYESLSAEEREVFAQVFQEVLTTKTEGEMATAPTEPPLTPKAEAEVQTKADPEPNRSPVPEVAEVAVTLDNEAAQVAATDKKE